MNRITADNKLIKCNGRGNIVNGEFPMFTTGSGVEINAKASVLYVELEADYVTYEPWISILIDGERVTRTALNKGLNRIMVFNGMNPAEAKHVRITKDVQAIPDDCGHKVIFKAFELEGEPAELPQKALKLEFIGDSITSGEGLIGSKKLSDWIAWCFDSVTNYTNLIATEMNADYRVISQSGWGVCCGWDNDARNTLPSIYEKVCGSNLALKDTAFKSQEMYDFSSWQPDAIVINLGTNDCGAYGQPPFKNPETGEEFKNLRLEDGSRDRASVERFEKGVVNFLKTLRKNNPKAKLLWVYGILGGDLGEDITEAIEIYKTESKDTNVFFIQYPEMTEEQTGARFHPGKGAHELMARMTVEKLKNILEK